MDFMAIGTLHSYVQQKNFKFAADYKKKTGQTIINSSGNLKLDLKAANNQSLVDKMLQAQQANRDDYSKQKVSSIKQKLLSGRKISNEELGYLKENAPDLYKKAKKVEETREELKSALRKAKTKSEARKAVTQALVKASAESSAELDAAKKGIGNASGINIFGSSQNVNEINNSNVQMNLSESINDKSENLNMNDPNNSLKVDENEENSTTSIIEKFIMKVRAIEDEWFTFAKTDDYKNLAEDETADEQKIKLPNQKILKMISAYRKSAQMKK